VFKAIKHLHRGARAVAASALIIAISATSLGGTANAAPSDDDRGCSVLAHERNASVHRLHEAWQGFRTSLRDLARESRQAQRALRGSETATSLVTDARADLADARQALGELWRTAHEELQSRVELGSACKDPAEPVAEPPVTLATLEANGDLVKKYREVVDEAIKDMQAVVDGVTDGVATLVTAAESNDATAKAKRGKDRERSKPDATGKPDVAGNRERGPRR